MFRARKRALIFRCNCAALLNNKADHPTALAPFTFSGVSSTRRHSDIRIFRAFATNENDASSGFAHSITWEAKTWSKSLRDGYSCVELNFSQWRAIVFDRTQHIKPACFSCSTSAKTFARSRPTTERRLTLRPSRSFTLHSRKNASKYSEVPAFPIIANSVMLLGCDSKQERVRRAKLCGGRPYFSISSRLASSECKSMNTPPRSKMTALVMAHCSLLRSLISRAYGVMEAGFDNLREQDQLPLPRASEACSERVFIK